MVADEGSPVNPAEPDGLACLLPDVDDLGVQRAAAGIVDRISAVAAHQPQQPVNLAHLGPRQRMPPAGEWDALRAEYEQTDWAGSSIPKNRAAANPPSK